MGKIKKWVDKKIAIVSLAMSNVEKNMLGQSGDLLTDNTKNIQKNTQGQLADSLVNGEITQEVIDLRWRTYKVLDEMSKSYTKFIGYDENGEPIIETKTIDTEESLKKIKIDEIDPYPLEMVVDNKEITIDVNDIINNGLLKVNEKPILNNDENESASHGLINGDDFFASQKNERPIKVGREFFPKFYIENYTEKVNIRTIDENYKLIEFAVNCYPSENKNHNLFLKEINKAIDNPISCNMLEIKEVGFITNKTIGVKDFLEYKYEITCFDKITKFNGFYLIKFFGFLVINGENKLTEFISHELEDKYKNKVKKK